MLEVLRTENAVSEISMDTSFVQTVTDLVFTGNHEQAFDFIHQAWPPEINGKEDFIRQYQEALGWSAYNSEFESRVATL